MSEPIIMNVNSWLLTVQSGKDKAGTFHSRKAERMTRNTEIIRNRYMQQYTLFAYAAARYHRMSVEALERGLVTSARYWQNEAALYHASSVRARLLWELSKTDVGAGIARLSDNGVYGKFVIPPNMPYVVGEKCNDAAETMSASQREKLAGNRGTRSCEICNGPNGLHHVIFDGYACAQCQSMWDS